MHACPCPPALPLNRRRALERSVGGTNLVARVVLCCVNCVLKCVESCLKWVTAYAYVYVAIYGVSFIKVPI